MTTKVKLILLVLTVLFCYGNTARNSFMWDDDQYISDNGRIQSLKNVPALFVPQEAEPYRPLRLLTFAVENALYGLNPAMYHVDNMLLHLLNVLLLFALLRLVLKDEELAFYSALIFAVYPAWNEAVVWVKNRSMLLAGLFMFSGLYFYAKKKTPLALLAFALGLLSKEIMVAFPAIITAYAYLFDKDRNKTDLVSFWVIGLVWTVFLFSFYGGQAGSYPPGAALLFSLKVMLRFLLILLFPFRLNAEREVAFPETIFDAEVIISFVLTVLAAVWLYRDRFRNKALSFMLLWMIFNIFPTANPGVVSGRPLAEHRLYIVGAGFSVLLAMALRNRKVLLYALLPVFLVTSFKRNVDWKDPHTFWSRTVKAAPSSPRAYTNLALAEKLRGNLTKAEEYLAKALLLDPDYIFAVNARAGLLVEKGEVKEAEALLLGGIKNHPAEIALYKDLIDLYLLQGRRKEAAALCAKGAALADIEVGKIADYLPIGVSAFKLGLLEEAGQIFKKAAAAQPWNVYIANNLASVHHAGGNYPEAEKYYKLAIKMQPSDPTHYYNLANLYYNTKAFNQAAANYSRAVELDESYSDAWYNLGVVYKEAGNPDGAKLCFEKVKEIEG